MTTGEGVEVVMSQTLVERGDVLEAVSEWEAGLQALHGRIANRFSRSESRHRVLAYLQGLLGRVEAQEWVAVGRVCRRRHARRGATTAVHSPVGCGAGPG